MTIRLCGYRVYYYFLIEQYVIYIIRLRHDNKQSYVNRFIEDWIDYDNLKNIIPN